MQAKPRVALLSVGLFVLILASETLGGRRAFSGIQLSGVSLGASGGLGVVRAEPAIKIAYFDPQAVLAAAPGRATAESLLSVDVARDDARLKKMQDSINGVLAKYQKDEPTMSAAAKDRGMKSIQAIEDDYRTKQAQFQQELQQRENEVMAPITDLVRKVLGEIREEGGYAMIFNNDPRTSLIAVADKNLDITDRVISRLRATPAPSKVPAAKGAPTAPAGVSRPPAR